MSNLKRMKTVLLAGLLILALSVFVAACGSDDSSSDSGSSSGGDATASQEEAQAAIDAASKIPEFTLEAEPVDVEKVKGKSIFNIPVTSAIPYVAAVDDQMEEIAKQLGIEFIQFENEGTPTDWARGIDQAVSQGVDMINLDSGLDPSLVIPQLKKAKQAGIPVQVSHLYQNGDGPSPDYADLITSYITVPFAESGRLSVEYAVAQDACDVDVLIITASEVPPSDGIVEAMQERLTELCPDANNKVVNVPVVDWGTKITPEVQSALQANPDINWILPIYDSMALPAEAGVKAAQKGNDVGIASYNGTPDILKLIQDGDIVKADMGENINWLGYAFMDQALRTLGGGPIIEDGNEETPLRVFDDSNIDETGTPPQGNEGYGDAYVTGYEELWGIN